MIYNMNNNILYVILSGLWLHLFYNYKMPITYNLISGAKKNTGR
jgi:hypothetical protein